MIDQLNARLGQFIALAESYRMHDISSRVAGCLAELFNPQLNPQTHPVLHISQEEIGRLAGISARSPIAPCTSWRKRACFTSATEASTS